MTQRTTPSPLLVKIAVLIRDLLNVTETTVRIGRQNFQQSDFTSSFIVIDQMGGSDILATNEKFDGADEVMSFNSFHKTEIIVDFLGNDAYTNANRLTGLLRSQAAFEKKQSLGVDVLNVGSLTDLKHLTGQQFTNRIQMSFVAQDNRTVDVETLRIDTAQFFFMNEHGEI